MIALIHVEQQPSFYTPFKQAKGNESQDEALHVEDGGVKGFTANREVAIGDGHKIVIRRGHLHESLCQAGLRAPTRE